MLTVHVLGAGSGLPTARRDTTSLLVHGAGEWTLVDCPGSVVHKLARHGVRPGDLARLVLTHDHVDHIYGLPHLIHAVAISGPGATLRLHAPAATLETVARLVDALGLEGDRYPELHMEEIPAEPGIPVAESEGLRITAAPTLHGRDTRALRFECAGNVACYSSDTRRSEALAGLFAGADLLLHDCAGLHAHREDFASNHSSAREAGEIAAAASVRELLLIHLSPEAERDEAALVKEAEGTFGGRVGVARDGELIRLPRPWPGGAS